MFGLAHNAVGVQIESSELCKHPPEQGQCQSAAGLFHCLLVQKLQRNIPFARASMSRRYVNVTRCTISFLHSRGSQPVQGNFQDFSSPALSERKNKLIMLAHHCTKRHSALIIPFQKHGLFCCRWEDTEVQRSEDMAMDGWISADTPPRQW